MHSDTSAAGSCLKLESPPNWEFRFWPRTKNSYDFLQVAFSVSMAVTAPGLILDFAGCITAGSEIGVVKFSPHSLPGAAIAQAAHQQEGICQLPQSPLGFSHRR